MKQIPFRNQDRQIATYLLLFCFSLLLTIFKTQTAFAEGNEGGGGGTGVAYLFTKIASRSVEHLTTHPVELRRLADSKSAWSLEQFSSAVKGTKVLGTDEILYDRDGHEVTAVHYDQQTLREFYTKRGLNEDQVTQRLTRMPYGLIKVNNSRFLNELSANKNLALFVVLHEYTRAMGLDEDMYRTTVALFDTVFLNRMVAELFVTPISPQDFGRFKTPYEW